MQSYACKQSDSHSIATRMRTDWQCVCHTRHCPSKHTIPFLPRNWRLGIACCAEGPPPIDCEAALRTRNLKMSVHSSAADMLGHVSSVHCLAPKTKIGPTAKRLPLRAPSVWYVPFGGMHWINSLGPSSPSKPHFMPSEDTTLGNVRTCGSLSVPSRCCFLLHLNPFCIFLISIMAVLLWVVSTYDRTQPTHLRFLRFERPPRHDSARRQRGPANAKGHGAVTWARTSFFDAWGVHPRRA